MLRLAHGEVERSRIEPDERLAGANALPRLDEHRRDGSGDLDGDAARGAGAYSATGGDVEDQIAVARFLGDDREADVGSGFLTACRGLGGVIAVGGRFTGGFTGAAGGEQEGQRKKAGDRHEGQSHAESGVKATPHRRATAVRKSTAGGE